MRDEIDFWDPNNWGLIDQDHEYRIYGDDRASTWAVVDREDFLHFSQWRWYENKPMPGKRNGKKKYLCRNTSNGRRYGPKLYLHIEIMKRSKKRKPSPLHTIVDHKDGNEKHCRKQNMKWSTPKQNGRKKKRHAR